MNPSLVNFSAAATVAAASGQTIIPSVLANEYMASLISESSTATAVPLDSLIAFKIK